MKGNETKRVRVRSILLVVTAFAAISVVAVPAAAGKGVSPPAGRIAFASDRDWGTVPSSQIYAVNADGTSLVRLTNFSWWAFQPTWSPDGNEIAFTGIRPEAFFRFGPGETHLQFHAHDIYVMDADGSHVKNLTGGTLQNVAPSWSPDGRAIAFVRKPPFTGQNPYPAHIAVMNADGTGVVEITSGSNFDYRPTWSPDGQRIAFERSFTAGRDAIVIVNRDGSGLTELLDGVCCMDPAWSPDGTRISFWNSDRQALQTIDLLSKRIRTLATASQLGGGPFFDQFTSWSSDGRWLAFGGCCDVSTDLYLIAADGSGTIKVPNGEFATASTWAPTAG